MFYNISYTIKLNVCWQINIITSKYFCFIKLFVILPYSSLVVETSTIIFDFLYPQQCYDILVAIFGLSCFLIRYYFDNVVPKLQINTQQHNITPLCVLRSATTLEVRTIIMNSPSKSCELDSVPTWLLKKRIDEILPSIVRLVNTSLRSGRFPDCFKEAVIRPILKKPNFETNDLKNYRPLSNLQFVSKNH